MKKELKPRLRVTSLIEQDGKFLLIEEAIKPLNNRICWLAPGGGLEFSETLEQAVVRELKEETGLDVKVIKFLTYFERIYEDKDFHSVMFAFLATPTGGKLKKEPGIISMEWFTKEEALKLETLTSSTRAMLELI